MDREKNEKVLAMYHAVCELIDEGYTVSSMKVADITARAGIGKGTAYEYFRSKEEIISEALKYDYFVQYKSLSACLEQQNSFRGALETCFNWLSENVDRKRFASQFIYESPKESMDGEKKKTCEDTLYLLKLMVDLGKKDGSIRAEITEEMAIIQIVSQLFGYYLYQENKKDDVLLELDVMKQFLCDNIEKSLK